MRDPPIPIHVELCIPNDETLQKEVWHEILKRNLSDSVEVWPYATIESFAPVKVITPTATGDIIDPQTAAIAALFSKGWLAKEIKHAIKNQTLPPGSTPILIKTNHHPAHTLLVSSLQWGEALSDPSLLGAISPLQWGANEQIETKNVFYAVRSTLKEAQRLGFHRIALPVTDVRHIGQMLDAI